MAHVALVGDSILDNGAYVDRGGDVSTKLEQRLSGGEVTLLARDGALIEGAIAQLKNVPRGVTLLVISAGGNDALRSIGVLGDPARTVGDGLAKVLTVRNRFAENYRALLNAAQRLGHPTAVCTIYDVQLPDFQERQLANLALGVLNDVITREAASRGLALVDLRVMFTREDHYANAIEPSELGSELIAAAIQSAVELHRPGTASIYTAS